MPNKTIYITETDLPIFNQAQELAGNNLSATIVEALKRFIKNEEGKRAGYDEVVIKLGENGTYQNKRFIGKEMARSQSFDDENAGIAKVWIVYETAKNHYALYTKEIHDISDTLMQMKINQKLAEKFGVDQEFLIPQSVNKYSLEVYDTKAELKDHIPEHLYKLLNQSQDQDDFLDI